MRCKNRKRLWETLSRHHIAYYTFYSLFLLVLHEFCGSYYYETSYIFSDLT
jgi:hypothetical protein